MKESVSFLSNKTNPYHEILGPKFPAVHPLMIDISFSDQILVELNSLLVLNTDPLGIIIPPPPPEEVIYLVWGKHLITQACLTFLTCHKFRNCSALKIVF